MPEKTKKITQASLEEAAYERLEDIEKWAQLYYELMRNLPREKPTMLHYYLGKEYSDHSS